MQREWDSYLASGRRDSKDTHDLAVKKDEWCDRPMQIVGASENLAGFPDRLNPQ